MGIIKICDDCGQEIKNKNNDKYGFSEWAVWHWKKERFFCCDKCFLRFVMKRLILNEEKKND